MKRVFCLGLLGLVLLGAAPVISYNAPQQVKRIRLTVENAGNACAGRATAIAVMTAANVTIARRIVMTSSYG